jgi:HEAT repeat protein
MARLSLISLAISLCAALGAARQPSTSDPRQRQRTVRELGKQGSESIPTIQEYLKDPDVEVRIDAVKAIVDIGTQRSLDPLIQATHDNEAEIQIRATDGLVNFYVPGYVQTGLTASLRRAGKALKSRWTDTNDQVVDPFVQVRAEVIEALGRLARGGVSMDSRANAARAVGVLRGRAAIPDLLESLRSKDDKVLYESLVALQKIRDPAVAPRIIFLLRDLNEKVQIAAIETVGLLRNKEALPRLREALESTRPAKVRRAALVAIAMIPDESNRDLFSRYFGDKDAALRAGAAEGFGRLQNPGDRPLVEKAFNEERAMNARLSQAFALVLLGDRSIAEHSPLQYLINTLNSRSYRNVALAFLVELTRDAGVRKSAQEAALKGTRDEKMMLAQILARSGDTDTLPVLQALSQDPDAEVAQEGVRALRNLRARLP